MYLRRAVMLLAITTAACVGRSGFETASGGATACGSGCTGLPIGTFKRFDDAVIDTGLGYLNGQDLAIDSRGYPAVVWTQLDGSTSHIYYAQWNGSAWAGLGDSATSGTGVDVGTGGPLRFGTDDRPNIAWIGAGNGIFFRRFDGAAWSELAGSGSTGIDAPGISVVMALAPNDTPVVSWMTNAGGPSDIYLRRYADPNWEELAGSASGDGINATATEYASNPDVAVGPTGDLFVGWAQVVAGTSQVYVKRYDGLSWSELAGSASGAGVSGASHPAYNTSIVVDRDNRPFVAWIDNASGANEIYLRRYDGAAWAELGGSASGGGVSAMGLTSQSVDVALDQHDNPVVSWTQDLGSNRRVYLRRWSGASWNGIDGSDVDDGIGRAQIGSDANIRIDIRGDELCVMWTHGDSQSFPSVRVACMRLP